MADDGALLGPVPEKFDPDKHYKVNLAETVVVLGQTLNPKHPPTLAGDLAEGIRGKIVGACEV